MTSKSRRVRTLFPLLAAMTAVAVVLVPSPAGAAAGDQVTTTGLGSDGQLGTGTTASRTSLGTITALTDPDDVAGGREHVVAMAAGEVWTWGDGSKGALGLGNLADRLTPTRVPGLSGVTDVTTGHYHSLALLADGTVKTWGQNLFGQLGDGSTTRRTSPVTVAGLSGVGLSPVVELAAGADMSYARRADGTVWAWGRGDHGELGNGTLTTRATTPVPVSGLTSVVALAGGRNHVLAVLADGHVKAWGANDAGQLGDGTLTSRSLPVDVAGIPNAAAGIPNAVGVAAGATHSVALLADGRVMTWGAGAKGQLGLGTLTRKLVPNVVTGLPAIAQVGCGRDHTLAISATGTLYAWGVNDYGQLGDLTLTRRTRPVLVPGASNVLQAHGGRGYSVVRTAPLP